MENGSELLRLLAKLQDLPPGSNEGVAIWALAIMVRELATGTILLNGALAQLIADNDLARSPDLAKEMSKIHNVSKALHDEADAVAKQFKPPEAQD
jgi:hypothetical protein